MIETEGGGGKEGRSVGAIEHTGEQTAAPVKTRVTGEVEITGVEFHVSNTGIMVPKMPHITLVRPFQWRRRMSGKVEDTGEELPTVRAVRDAVRYRRHRRRCLRS